MTWRFWCPWRSDVSSVLMSWTTRDDHTRVRATCYRRRGADGVITSIDADVGDRCAAMCSEVHAGVSWTKMTLDACSRGFLTLKNLDVVPLKSSDAVTLSCIISQSWLMVYQLKWWQIICFTPQVIIYYNLIVLDQICIVW